MFVWLLLLLFIFNTNNHLDEEALLLRGSGIFPAVVAQSCIHHGRLYLQNVIAPVLHTWVHKPSLSFEVDAQRAGSEQLAKQNMEHLVNAANHVLAALLSNVDAVPVYVRCSLHFFFFFFLFPFLLPILVLSVEH